MTRAAAAHSNLPPEPPACLLQRNDGGADVEQPPRALDQDPRRAEVARRRHDGGLLQQRDHRARSRRHGRRGGREGRGGGQSVAIGRIELRKTQRETTDRHAGVVFRFQLGSSCRDSDPFLRPLCSRWGFSWPGSARTTRLRAAPAQQSAGPACRRSRPAVVGEVGTTASEHAETLRSQIDALASGIEALLPASGALPRRHVALGLVALMVGGLSLSRCGVRHAALGRGARGLAGAGRARHARRRREVKRERGDGR